MTKYWNNLKALQAGGNVGRSTVELEANDKLSTVGKSKGSWKKKVSKKVAKYLAAWVKSEREAAIGDKHVELKSKKNAANEDVGVVVQQEKEKELEQNENEKKLKEQEA